MEDCIEDLESERKSDSSFIPFENNSFLSEREDSQNEDFFDQDNSNSPIVNEDIRSNPLSSDSFKEEKKNQEIENYLLYSNYQKKTDIKEITFNLEINNNKEKKIRFEEVFINEKSIHYEIFKKFSKEEIKNQFKLNENNILFENIEKIKEYLNKIEKNDNDFFSEIKLGNELPIQIKLNEENNKINSKYILNALYLKVKQHQDKDILNNNNYGGFALFLKEIRESFSNQTNINNNSTKDATNDSNQIKNTSFISFKKIIGKHKGFAQKIRKLNNGSFISGGHDGIIQYDTNFTQTEKYNNQNEEEDDYIPFFIDENEVIISLKDKFTFLSKQGTKSPNIKGIYPCWNLFELKPKKYIICNANGIYFASDIFSNSNLLINNPYKLYEKDYRGGIKINDYIIAITSNRCLKNGENKLVFFSSKSQKFLKDFEIPKYSFTLSENNCSIMKIQKHQNSILLLVACKKYDKDDKNGILFIQLDFNEDDIIEECHDFCDTKDFEVYCFCPLLKRENKTILEIIESEYFLVGGYDSINKKGLILLYRVIYNDKTKKIEIEFIQDIKIEKKKGKNDYECFEQFEKSISCIIQSPQLEILVTCNDGNVYLFSEPNFEEEKEIEDKKNFESFTQNL